MTSLHLTGILFTSFWQCSGVIVLQASRICSVSCSFVLGVFAATLMPMIYQRFSIGLRSGLCAGQLIHSKFCLCPLLYQFRSVTGGIAVLEHPPQSLFREEHQGTWHNLTPQWWDLFLSIHHAFTLHQKTHSRSCHASPYHHRRWMFHTNGQAFWYPFLPNLPANLWFPSMVIHIKAAFIWEQYSLPLGNSPIFVSEPGQQVASP